jgi:hypothetical protein
MYHYVKKDNAAHAKKQTLKQPMKQAIKQQARELAVDVTMQDQHSKASGSCSVFATRYFTGTARIASPF